MNALSHVLPLFAVVLSQMPEIDGKLAIYGPMGIICLWLMHRDQKQREDYMKIHADSRLDNAKLRDEISAVAHQMKGLNRNLLYVTATHGPAGLREVAEKELERHNQG